MLRTFTLAAAATALTAGTAFAACGDRMKEVGQDYARFLSAEGIADTESRPVIQELRDAAFRLNRQGLEESCNAVVDAMDTAIAEYRRIAIEEAEDAADATPPSETGQDELAAETREDEAEEAERAAGKEQLPPAAIDAAAPLPADVQRAPEEVRAEIEARTITLAEAGMVIDTTNLAGVNVYSFENRSLGEADGLLISAERGATHLIVAHGGFWNIGESRTAIPLEEVRWNPENQVFHVDLTPEQLAEAEKLDGDAAWVAKQGGEPYSN